MKALIVGVILFSIVMTLIVAPQLPQTMVTHWGMDGEPNGFMTKGIALWFVPALTIALAALLLWLPRIDPLRRNVKEFFPMYEAFVLVLVTFLTIVHFTVLLWNLGVAFDIGRAIIPGMGLLMYALGALLSRSKRNWFIGIRTPWTLSSDTVWEKTHKLGGVLFRMSGLLMLAGIFSPHFWLVFGPIVATVVITTLYSYVLYQRATQ